MVHYYTANGKVVESTSHLTGYKELSEGQYVIAKFFAFGNTREDVVFLVKGVYEIFKAAEQSVQADLLPCGHDKVNLDNNGSGEFCGACKYASR